MRLDKALALYLIWLSFLLKEDLFQQIFEFLFFVFAKLRRRLGSDSRIKRYLIDYIIKKRDFKFVETKFVEYHLALDLILDFKSKMSVKNNGPRMAENRPPENTNYPKNSNISSQSKRIKKIAVKSEQREFGNKFHTKLGLAFNTFGRKKLEKLSYQMRLQLKTP